MTNNSIKAAFQRFWEHVVARLDDKADVNHTHDYADSVHNHDDIYYTESEIDAKLSEVSESIDNLTYSWNDLEDKPFGEIERKTVICESYGEINPGPFLIDNWSPADLSLIEEGESYIVEIDGVEYGPSVARFVEEMQAGNMVLALKLFNPDNYSFEEFPVSISDYAGGIYIYFEDGGTHNVKLKHLETSFKQLDEQYIPETIARTSALESYETKSDAFAKLTEAKAYADEVGSGLQTQLNTIMNNPDTEGVINSINEFTQYITEHGEIAEGFRTDIDSKASQELVNGHIEDKIVHITSEERDAWNAIAENAKTYTDEQIAALLAAFEITVEDIDEICGSTNTETILDETTV